MKKKDVNLIIWQIIFIVTITFSILLSYLLIQNKVLKQILPALSISIILINNLLSNSKEANDKPIINFLKQVLNVGPILKSTVFILWSINVFIIVVSLKNYQKHKNLVEIEGYLLSNTNEPIAGLVLLCSKLDTITTFANNGFFKFDYVNVRGQDSIKIIAINKLGETSRYVKPDCKNIIIQFEEPYLPFPFNTYYFDVDINFFTEYFNRNYNIESKIILGDEVLLVTNKVTKIVRQIIHAYNNIIKANYEYEESALENEYFDDDGSYYSLEYPPVNYRVENYAEMIQDDNWTVDFEFDKIGDSVIIYFSTLRFKRVIDIAEIDKQQYEHIHSVYEYLYKERISYNFGYEYLIPAMESEDCASDIKFIGGMKLHSFFPKIKVHVLILKNTEDEKVRIKGFNKNGFLMDKFDNTIDDCDTINERWIPKYFVLEPNRSLIIPLYVYLEFDDIFSSNFNLFLQKNSFQELSKKAKKDLLDLNLVLRGCPLKDDSAILSLLINQPQLINDFQDSNYFEHDILSYMYDPVSINIGKNNYPIRKFASEKPLLTQNDRYFTEGGSCPFVYSKNNNNWMELQEKSKQIFKTYATFLKLFN